MVFTVLACTDILGAKINIELPFDELPAKIDELHRTLEGVFRAEEKAMRQQDSTTLNGKTRPPSEPFALTLKDVRQLRAYDQLYVFRKHATKADISAQREIPAPRCYYIFFHPDIRQEEYWVEVLEKVHNHNHYHPHYYDKEKEKKVHHYQHHPIHESGERGSF
ncbi:BILBO1 [Trypanosoma melophagium]|uniref:BILBO1 n=1 Tax=Trypanosoma melophagium TaxID=715481 RepID=UPI00351A266A|nr:BILBO1 [Trypanosoma melophagium]